MSINKGSIHWCRLPEYSTNVLNKTRPCIVISNSVHNRGSSTINVIPLTTKKKRMDLPIHVLIGESVAHVENIITVDVDNVGDFIRHMTPYEQNKIDIALLTQIGFIGSVRW